MTPHQLEQLSAEYSKVRSRTQSLCEPLAVEDYGVQPMDDASPPKWHLALSLIHISEPTRPY